MGGHERTTTIKTAVFVDSAFCMGACVVAVVRQVRGRHRLRIHYCGEKFQPPNNATAAAAAAADGRMTRSSSTDDRASIVIRMSNLAKSASDDDH
jgi:hypothetical protein